MLFSYFTGGMAERSKAAVLKTVSRKRDVGSNPTPSASFTEKVTFKLYNPPERWPSWLKALAC